mmetsp:Transcript_2472/g.5101  ORF Transcript_2472/g.5101 Transcript_2472/m.5101 type:complete len:273 (+) Transcript_2472:405-1223(+)
MERHSVKCLVSRCVVIGVRPPRVDIDAMIELDKQLQLVNQPCVVVAHLREAKAPPLRNAMVVSMPPLAQQLVAELDTCDPRAVRVNDLLVCALCVIRAAAAVEQLNPILVHHRVPVLIEAVVVGYIARRISSVALEDLVQDVVRPVPHCVVEQRLSRLRIDVRAKQLVCTSDTQIMDAWRWHEPMDTLAKVVKIVVHLGINLLLAHALVTQHIFHLLELCGLKDHPHITQCDEVGLLELVVHRNFGAILKMVGVACDARVAILDVFRWRIKL